LRQVLEFLADVVVGLASEPGDLADIEGLGWMGEE